MKLLSSPTLGLVCIVSVFCLDNRIDCKDVAASGLMDALFLGVSLATQPDAQQGEQGERGQPGAPGAQGEQGQPGPAGADGVNCWDLNGNGMADDNEDLNGDGTVDVLDCQGADGMDGTDGAAGVDGTDGANGMDGAPGVNCWDLNGNGMGDPEEDLNGDQVVDVMDCQGPEGQQGPAGVDIGNVLGRGFIDADGTFDPESTLNILGTGGVGQVTKPATGLYEVTIDFSSFAPERQPADLNDLTVLIQVMAFDNGLGAAELRWAFYEATVDPVAETVTLNIQIRSLTNPFVDNAFSLAVMGP